MGVPGLAPPHDRYDCLFVSPHADDVALSCPGRLLWERDRGSRCLVLALFESADVSSEVATALRRLGVDYLAAGLPPARRRLAADAPFGEVGFGRRDEDEDWLAQAVRLLAEVGPRIKPRHVYAPLGVGGHIDHRLAHEAALRAFASEAGRNVFFYEERPASGGWPGPGTRSARSARGSSPWSTRSRTSRERRFGRRWRRSCPEAGRAASAGAGGSR